MIAVLMAGLWIGYGVLYSGIAELAGHQEVSTMYALLGPSKAPKIPIPKAGPSTSPSPGTIRKGGRA